MSEDRALASRLASLHRFDRDDVETAQHEAARLDGRGLAEPASRLAVRKFLAADPLPAGRVRVHGVTALQYYGSELTCGDAHGKVTEIPGGSQPLQRSSWAGCGSEPRVASLSHARAARP